MTSNDRPSHDEPTDSDSTDQDQKPEALQDALSVELKMGGQAGDQLINPEERLQLMIAGAEDYAFFIVDTEGRIVTWNIGARKLFGYDNEEAVGQLFEVIFTEEDRQAGVPDRELNLAMKQGASDDDRWHVKKDGSRFWAHGVTTALKSQEGIRGFAK